MMNSSSGKFSFEAIDRIIKLDGKWEQVQPTFQLAFNAVSETLKLHENYIKELELQLSNRPSRHEIAGELSEKVSFSELSEKFSHINSILEARLVMADDKISASEVQKLLSDRIKYEEVKKLLESKASVKEMNEEFDAIYAQIDKVYKEISSSLSKMTNVKDKSFSEELKSKSTVTQLEEITSKKAEEIISKKLENFSKNLKNKADKSDLIKKADITDIKTIVGVLETKVDCDFSAKINTRLEKIEKNEQFSKKRLEKYLKETSEETKSQISTELNLKMNEYITEINEYIEEIDNKILQIKDQPKPKIKPSELEFIKEKISENNSWMTQEIEGLKERINDIMLNFNNELSIERTNGRDVFLQRIELLENSVKEADKKIQEIHNDTLYLNHYLPLIKGNDEQISQITQKIKEITGKYTNCNEAIASINEMMLKKAEASEVEMLIHEKNRVIVNNLHEIREEIKFKLQQIQSETLKKTQKFYEKKETEHFLEQKVDKHEMEYVYKKIQDLGKSIEYSVLQLEDVFKSSLKTISDGFEEKLSFVTAELQEKSWTADIVKMIDSKSNIEDINKILLSLHNEIDEKVDTKDFEVFTSENSIVLNTLCAETCIGRWLWKMGGLKDGLIVWDEENTNTNPLLFIWESKRNFVLIEEPGIYEIVFAIFAMGTIEIFINGQTSFSIKSHNKEKSSISKTKYFVLPSRSRVSLKFIGESGQGFFSLRKL